MTQTTSTVTIRAIAKFDSSPVYRFVRREEFGILCATIALILFAALFAEGFLDPANLLSIAQQISIVTIVAVGMTYVIVAGEIDLSVGSQYGFLAIFAAWTVRDIGIPIGAAVPLVLIVGTLIGALNGIFTTLFKIPSFVVTLAALAILRGAALLLSGGVPILGSENEFFKAVTSGQVLPGLVAQTLWAIAIVLILGVVLAFTRFGSNVYSVGGNMKAADDAGIKVKLTKISCFALTGLLCAMASLLLIGWLGSANPLTGTGFELDVIAAVVVGGAVLTGGRGSVFGTVLGAIIAGVLNNALVLAGVDGNWKQVATGLLILAAVLVNQLLPKLMKRKSQ